MILKITITGYLTAFIGELIRTLPDIIQLAQNYSAAIQTDTCTRQN